MKKLINDPLNVVENMLDGLVSCTPTLARLQGFSVVVRSDYLAARDARVALISGGGSGHEPSHAGFVGRGALSAAVLGNVFTSPDVDTIYAAIRAVTGPMGCLLIVKNYTGDRLNFGLAAELARADGLQVEVVSVADDTALENPAVGQRGIAGTVLVHKIAGAAAEGGADLATVAKVARGVAENVASMGVGLSGCTIPAVGKPNFTLAEDEVEMGLGIHGEPGRERLKGGIPSASAVAQRLLDRAASVRYGSPEGLAGRRLVLLVNNLGGTSIMELFVVAGAARRHLEAKGAVVERCLVGSFMTAMEMAGVSLSFLAVDDATLARIDAPTEAPAWPRVAPFSVAAHRPEARPPHLAQPAAADALAPPRPLGPVGLLLARCIGKVCGAALEATESLNALDAAVGDGDMGMNIRNGAEAVMRSLPGPDGHPRERRASDAEAKPPGRSASPARRPSVSAVAPLPADDPVKCMAHVAGLLRHSVGGTSGPLYAVFFLRLSSALAAAQQRGASALDPHAWAEAFRAGVEGVMALGGASAGDRTAVDALLPAAAALQDAIARKEGGGAALAAAAAAAEAGAEKTKGMVPRRGRASYVGARAAGHADPGAVAAGVLLRALAGAVESHGQTETSRFLSPGML